MIVPTQNHVGSGSEQPLVHRAPVRQPHAARQTSGQHVVMKSENASGPGRGRRKDLLDPIRLGARKMTLHRQVPEPPRHGAERHPVAAERSSNDSAGNFEYGSKMIEVQVVLGVLPLFTEKPERALPPLDVMVARDDDWRRREAHPLDEQVRRLKLTVPGPLGEIAGHDDGRGFQRRKKVVERLDLLEVGIAPEVDIGEMDDRDVRRGHQITRIRYVNVPSPRAGTRHRNREIVEETFSAGTELETTLHSPARSSCTSTATALSVAFFSVTL